jgi:transcriptional regulator with XRE-family HTH domain
MNRKRAYPNLKTWRDDNRLGQREAAAKLGISQPFYCRLERGVYYPGRKLAKVISGETGVPLETVLGLA